VAASGSIVAPPIRTRPVIAAMEALRVAGLGRCPVRSVSHALSSTGASPRLTTVATLTPPSRTATK
jgi:hypothetical protein